jgi:hypothetical protein
MTLPNHGADPWHAVIDTAMDVVRDDEIKPGAVYSVMARSVAVLRRG